ncbi:uncharacterized protein FIBRA_01792 [Fibroporia radiculosa]|uniref:chitin synthase n=1 Tax=Fibroporia radiculosa TaxID=599839 RepID=J4GLD1_9APHY|nr:uncharacterized protein FIBRA_01792 [Fibroporia radiculosa]CCL99770.1 predicted protein [Fibroporia radiculosa]
MSQLTLDRVDHKVRESVISSASTGHTEDVAEYVHDGGLKAWLTVFGAFLALFCTFGQLNSFGTFQSWYTEHQLHNLPSSTISWIGSLQLWVFFFSVRTRHAPHALHAPNKLVQGGFVGRLFDQHGPRVLMIPGTVILVFSIMMTSISTALYQYILCQGILFGLGVGMIFYPAVAAVSTHFHRYRGTALGIAIAGSGLGGVVYPIMLRRLFLQVGFGWAVRISGFVCLALCLVALATVTSRIPAGRRVRPWFNSGMFYDARFVLTVVASIFISFGLFIPNFYIVDYAIAQSVSPTTAFYVLAIMNAGSVPGRLAPPFLSDAFGRFNLIVPCAFLAGLLALVLWTSARSLATIILFSVLFGFFSGGFNALIVSCIAQISDVEEVGTRVGMLYTIISFPSLGGGPAAGALLKFNHGSYTGMIILSGATLMTGSLCMLGARLKIDRYSDRADDWLATMSRYPEADEAQYGHYNDGHGPYPTYSNPYESQYHPQQQYELQPTPVPYEHEHQPFQPLHADPSMPFVGSQSPPHPSMYHSPPPPLNPFTNPAHSISPPPHLGPPIHPGSPPLLHAQSADYLNPGYGNMHSVTPPPVHIQHSPISLYDSGPSTEAFNDPDEDLDDAGDYPLLRRNHSLESASLPIPGEYAAVGQEDRDEETNIRYGRIPQRVPRRHKTIKKVELFQGNFVLDSAVPTKLLKMCGLQNEREFTHMRYSAATCDPNDFKDSGFTLRQVQYDPPRRTELFIVMTMYNEDEELFCRTMHGVMKNIAHLCKRDRSKTWGKDGWKKVVVCIVSDGRQKINSRTLSVIAAMGAYQEGVAKNIVNGKPVTAHIYEYTAQISVSPSMKLEGAEKGIVPVQIIFCLKEKNQKKINSHRWFFNAFGPILQPNVCVLLDVGTMPGPTSIYHLWKAFDINSNVGGACGEIVALKGKYGQNLINPLVAAQNFEYKMSNILDKPLESIFGFITVLPGAFSAYRYIALQNDHTGEGPLQKYFLGEKMHGAGADIFTANMYLAEDRILCWELVSKRGGAWILHYVKSAYAVTDVPDQVPELISQRRRWLNGSFFAGIHGTVKFHYIYRSSHTLLRKFWIHVEFIYQTYNLLFSWFSLGNFYIFFIILSDALEDPSFHLGTAISVVNTILNYFYLGLLIMCFLLSLGNRPQGAKWGYTLAFVGFAFITVYMTAAAFFLAVKGIQNVIHADGPLTVSSLFGNAIFRDIVLSVLSTYGLYILASLIHFEPWHMITSFLQYLLMAPSYIAVLNVYAFANVHDVSWGTKGDNKVSTDLGVVTTGKNKNEVEVAVPTAETDINAAYDDAIHVLQTKPPKEDSKPDPQTEQEDYYRGFRTKYNLVLLSWTLSNGLLAAIIITLTGKASDKGATATVDGYMAFILFSVAGLAFVRFVGSTAYLLVRLFAGE